MAAARKKIPTRVRLSAWEAFNGKVEGRCYFCRDVLLYANSVTAHLVSVKNEGTNAESNVVPSCRACNGEMASMNARDWLIKEKNKGNHKYMEAMADLYSRDPPAAVPTRTVSTPAPRAAPATAAAPAPAPSPPEKRRDPPEKTPISPRRTTKRAPPASSREVATDNTAEYFKTMVKVEKNCKTYVKDLYVHYEKWCESRGEKPKNAYAFGRKVGEEYRGTAPARAAPKGDYRTLSLAQLATVRKRLIIV